MKDIIEILKDDEQYYGEYGRQFLSNSQIATLLKDPQSFGKESTKTPAMLMGNYFHFAMTEPERVEEIKVIDVSTRSTKAYKELNEMALLTKEVDQLNGCIKAMKSNKKFFKDIYAKGNEYEVPGLIEIDGIMWKGKTDILAKDKLIDLKTTNDITKFWRSAQDYNYDSQAWLYQQMFGLPMEFYIVDKNTFRIGVATCSEEFLERGEQKVYKAIEQYKKFFGDNPTEDISQYYDEFIL